MIICIYSNKRIKELCCWQEGGRSIITLGNLGLNDQTFLDFCRKILNCKDNHQILKPVVTILEDLVVGPDCDFQQGK